MTTDGADRSFGAPRFDVVLRGYDRRQVDEHLSRLQRVVSRLRGDLDAARGLSVPAGPPVGPPTPPGLRPRPTPRPRPDMPTGREAPDVVGTFTDRMQTILQAAEDEAAEIRAKARSAARAEEEKLATSRASVRADEEMARVTLANLLRQRDAVLADLTRVRGQLEALLSGPTARIAVPTQGSTAAAAARRDAGAGHPLPGTPATPPADAPPDAEATVMARPVEQRPVEQRPVERRPVEPAGPARSDAAEADREPAAGPAVPAAEQTMVMAPAVDATSGETAPSAEVPEEEEAAPTGDAPQADAPADAPTSGVDDTVEVGAVGRPADNGGPEKGAVEDGRDPTNTDRDAVSNSR